MALILLLMLLPTMLMYTYFARPQDPGPYATPSQWKLVFFDDFNGTSLNLTKWSYNYPPDWSHGGHTLNHQAYMTEDNVIVEDGLLKLRAENQQDPNAPPPENVSGQMLYYNYTAAAINTKGKFNFTYGYIEGRFKMPTSQGFWPAFWLMNSNGEWPPEIDILEVLTNNPTTLHCTFHWGILPEHKQFSPHVQPLPDLSADFHNYGVEWTPDSISWFFDG
ncbi:MAG TPA: glycoside hydrolase family 16 protein, partial [Candidatus Lokiarchaeia archaeon]|nr:glycoside hydrolase family 16 protein [Candidatus Lokiarchaeia archaeon]